MPEAREPPAAALRVLVAQDGGDLRTTLDMLAAAGHDAAAASSLRTACQRLESAPPDVLLLDLALLEAAGDRDVGLLRAAAGHVPILALCLSEDGQAARRAALVGAHDTLAKGRFDAALLARALRHVLACGHAAGQVRAVEARYRSLFESMVDGFAHCRMIFEDGQPRDFVFLEVNHAYAALTGMNVVVGARVTDLIPGIREANPEMFEIYGRVASSGRPERFETYVAPLARWFDISVYSPSKGQFVAVFGNITERRSAEDALRTSEQRYRRLVETANEGILTLDSRGIITFANPTMAAMVGCTVAESVGRPLADFIFDKQQIPLWQSKLASRGALAREANEWRLLRRDGGTTWVSVSASPLPDAEGAGIGALAMISDITERKRADADLRLRTTALEAAANAILIGDRKGAVVWTNPAFSALTGYSREEALGMSITVLRSNTESPAFYLEREAAVLAGRVWKGALVNRRKDGTFYDEEMTITPVLNDGEVTHFIAVKEDVTERLREDATRARLAAILEATTDFVGMFDAAHRVLYVNRAGRRLVGVGEEEDLGGADISFCHPPWAAELVRTVGGPAAARDGVWEGESALLNRDGTEIPVSQVIIAHRGAHGRVDRLSTIMRDISDRRRAEEALQEQEEKLRLAVEGASLATWHRHLVSGHMDWSARCFTLFGLVPGQVLTDAAFLGTIHPADRQLVMSARREALAGGAYDVECRVVWPDGSEHWIASKGRAYFDAAGRPERLEGVARDVTEHKQLEEELRQAQKMEAVGRLAGGVAHDFNNLLGVILGYSELLMRGRDTSPAQRAKLAHIVKASEGAASLTRQLLAFSRKQVLEPRILDLNALVSDAVKMIGRLIGEDIRMTVAPAADLGQVQADPGQLEQVVMNLAVNARDAMPDGGTLSFATANVVMDEVTARAHADARAGPYVCLTVRDTGHGMDATTLSHLYEPFFTTKAQGKGTGLGLATVYGIVTQSGGHIRVESEPGKGTSFGIYLPRVDTASPVSEPVSERAARRGSGTVLLVEDDEALRGLTRELLEANGYTVLVAANAEDALAASLGHGGAIDLLLTDVVMPGIHGRALADLLVAARPKMHVVFMSGYTDEAISHRGVLDPGTLLLRKPFTEESLTDKLREALDPAKDAH